MGKYFVCFRYVFVTFNSLFALFGCLLIFLAFTSSICWSLVTNEIIPLNALCNVPLILMMAYLSISPGNLLAILWVSGIVMVGLSCLGFSSLVYGWKVLLPFAGFMVVSIIITVTFGAIYASKGQTVPLFYDTTIELSFTFAAIALMGLVVSCMLICLQGEDDE